MSNDNPSQKELKVTDKRIFTSSGELREEFRGKIHPAAAEISASASPVPEPPPDVAPEPPAPTAAATPAEPATTQTGAGTREKEENPGTPFTMFLETLIVQAYMSLGMMKDPYNPGGRPNPVAARQMIDIMTLLQEKTTGNLTPEEQDFLKMHLGELKLAFVQRTKTI